MKKMSMDSIKIEELDGEQLEIAECVGIDGYKKLVRHFGGMSVYIQKADKSARDKEIKKLFDGYNYKTLARRFDLSESQIRRILSDA